MKGKGNTMEKIFGSLDFSNQVRENAILRASFNELTRETFSFDFTGWYNAGHWGECYIPHVLLDGEHVVSNVSVNLMPFSAGGEKKSYIQLGTVMTAKAYRGRGLNSRLMKRVIEEYKEKSDGIYLFANDSVLSYYPKFGFHPVKEYEYYLPLTGKRGVLPYALEKISRISAEQCGRLYEIIGSGLKDGAGNPNDGMYMDGNPGLYQFWLDAEFGDMLYLLPENGSYIAAGAEGGRLTLYQTFGEEKIDLLRLAAAFEGIQELVLGYTPADRGQLCVREHKEEDCTLFVLGEDLQRIEREKIMFPLLSHA